MNCQKYQYLSHIEKITYLGQIIHAVQSDDELFEMGQILIDMALSKGVFYGVKILPGVDDGKEDNKIVE